jgi:polyisoprenoid-binding protein YceI
MTLSSMVRRPLFWLISVPVAAVVVAFGGTFVYVHFVRSDPPEKLSFSDLPGDSSGTNASTGPPASAGSASASSTNSAAPAGIDGSWKVSQGQAGYRVHEVRFGNGLDAVGRTSEITGDLAISGTTVSSADLEVDLASVKTDESQRDDQFRGRIMNVSKFPEADFKLTQPIDLGSVPADGTEVTKQAVGQFTIHGVTKNDVSFDVVAKRSGAEIDINGSIDVKWADYDIPDPSFGPNQVDDHGVIEFVVAFTHA